MMPDICLEAEMRQLVEYVFGAASFVPHGYCLLWRPDLVAMHAVSDGVIAASYFSIPMALAMFVRRRFDLEYKWVFWLFAAFIVPAAPPILSAS
jgi:hypothetical protein